ncbi:MAG: molybdopterin-dependent oxidoreductase [Bacteroidota bacterium]
MPGCHNEPKKVSNSKDTLVQYPEKAKMLLLTDRPPQLETPIKVFRQDFTPNESFFVRWHLARVLTQIDMDTFRLEVVGQVKTTLKLSLTDLKTKFKPYSIAALCECAGNSRSLYKPRVPGSQWVNGGMGNAIWKGVKVKDILEYAGIKDSAVDIAYDGLDYGPFPGVPDFVKSLDVKHSMDGEVMIAYQMNGQDIPMLNGYPLKLVVPGWYATYWVGALHKIEVLPHKYEGFWMKKAYLIPNNPQAGEKPDSLSKDMVPITKLSLRSIFVEPEPDETGHVGKPTLVEGLAFDYGAGIKSVELSLDSGATWVAVKLDAEIGKYSWRRWRYDWAPSKKGLWHLKVRATNNDGVMQSEAQWNRSGYQRNVIEELDYKVE